MEDTLQYLDLEWYHYILMSLGGLLGGILNTLAGNGSAVTLSILLFLGVPADIANGTNRVGVLFQCFVSTLTFHANKKLNYKRGIPFVLITALGALLGIWIALIISPKQLEYVIGGLMILMFFVILLNPKRWLHAQDKKRPINWLLMIPLFLLLGFYGGFIQMGMGIFFLALMVLGIGMDITEANGIKLLAITFYTIFALAIFIFNDKVNWLLGFTLASGQMLGGWLAARFATQHPKANIWTHRILVLVVLTSIIDVFNLHHYFLKLF